MRWDVIHHEMRWDEMSILSWLKGSILLGLKHGNPLGNSKFPITYWMYEKDVATFPWQDHTSWALSLAWVSISTKFKADFQFQPYMRLISWLKSSTLLGLKHNPPFWPKASRYMLLVWEGCCNLFIARPHTSYKPAWVSTSTKFSSRL